MARKPKTPEPEYVISRERAPVFELPEGVTQKIAEDVYREMARVFGALGGAATKGVSTPKKRRSSRENGKLGGRPKGSKNKPRVRLSNSWDQTKS
jgi:hypothetical protein